MGFRLRSQFCDQLLIFSVKVFVFLAVALVLKIFAHEMFLVVLRLAEPEAGEQALEIPSSSRANAHHYER
jgi:hypothetical protein